MYFCRDSEIYLLYFLDLLYEYLFTSHIAAIAARDNVIQVRMHGFEFCIASGMACHVR